MRSLLLNVFRRPHIVLLAVCSIASCCGCGALGLYSLGHSVLSHNHVLKPILPDDGEEPAESGPAAAGLAVDNHSSPGARLPMERCRAEGQAGEMGSEKASDETGGE